MLHTCKNLQTVSSFHIVQVRSSVPGGGDDVISTGQPISSHHHSLVAAQFRQWRTEHFRPVPTFTQALFTTPL